MRSTAQCTPQRAIHRTTTTIRKNNTPGSHQGRRSAESSVGRQRRGSIIVRCAPELALGNSSAASRKFRHGHARRRVLQNQPARQPARSEEHTSELQSLMRISYAVFCLKKKNKKNT